MITLTLLHANKDVPAQIWTFEEQSVIRIGRAPDNHVILYSAVVSRHHVELHHDGSVWEVINLGANGTYWDGKRIDRTPVMDGMTIRLARSGPHVQIHLEAQPGNLGFPHMGAHSFPHGFPHPMENTTTQQNLAEAENDEPSESYSQDHPV